MADGEAATDGLTENAPGLAEPGATSWGLGAAPPGLIVPEGAACPVWDWLLDWPQATALPARIAPISRPTQMALKRSTPPRLQEADRC
ncbi:MAG: hypothetical protein JO023_25710 [Chloroflexi bacterium]|nr:hypothetical protein [Chloroflexota bacterium]